MLQDPGGALSTGCGSPEDQQNDVGMEIWKKGKPQIGVEERKPWIAAPYRLADEVKQKLTKYLDGCIGVKKTDAFEETKEEMDRRLQIFFEASKYAGQTRPGRKVVYRTDAQNNPVGGPVTATIPDDKDAYAAVAAARQHFAFKKKIYNVKQSVVSELMKEAMKTVHRKMVDSDSYEGVALAAAQLLDRMGDPSETMHRTVDEKEERFEQLTDWFREYLIFEFYRADEFDLLASFYIAVKMILHQNGNLVAFLQGYKVMDEENVMKNYDEWSQTPNFERLKERATSDQNVKFCCMSADAEAQLLNIVAEGAVDSEILWQEIEYERNFIETRVENFLKGHLYDADINFTVAEATNPTTFNEHHEQFEKAYNVKHSKCADEHKLKVNLFLADVLQQYYLQLLIASQLVNICLELKMKLRGDQTNLEQIFKDICTIDPEDADDVDHSELKTLIGLAASEGPSMEFYTDALRQRREKLSPSLKKVMGELFSSQKTVLNVTLSVKKDPTTFLTQQGLLQNGYLGPVAQVTAEVIASTSHVDLEATLMGAAPGGMASGVPDAIGEPEGATGNNTSNTTEASLIGSGGEEGGTVDATEQTTPTAFGDKDGSDEHEQAGAPLRTGSGSSSPSVPVVPRRLAPIPSMPGQGYPIFSNMGAARGNMPNLLTAMSKPAATGEPQSTGLEHVDTLLKDAEATDMVSQGFPGWARFDDDDESNAAKNGIVSRSAGIVRNLTKKFQGT